MQGRAEGVGPKHLPGGVELEEEEVVLPDGAGESCCPELSRFCGGVDGDEVFVAVGEAVGFEVVNLSNKVGNHNKNEKQGDEYWSFHKKKVDFVDCHHPRLYHHQRQDWYQYRKPIRGRQWE
ncbi:MAG: hypothetical protein R2788_22215 [Saprospiraceae bacterium]